MNLSKLSSFVGTPKVRSEEELHGDWITRWSLTPSPNGQYRGILLHATKSNIEPKVILGSSIADVKRKLATELDAVISASNKITTKSTIDFNQAFAEEYLTDGNSWYCNIIAVKQQPMLYISTHSFEQSRRITDRRAINKRTADSEKIQFGASISDSQIARANLSSRMRYVLGRREETDDGIIFFKLIPHSAMTGKRTVISEPAILIT